MTIKVIASPIVIINNFYSIIYFWKKNINYKSHNITHCNLQRTIFLLVEILASPNFNLKWNNLFYIFIKLHQIKMEY